MAAKSQSNSNESKHDDLTVINGIGEARELWLQETFNIRTFADLAALSADTILERMKSERQIISRNRIESWLTQAQQLVENPAPPLNEVVPIIATYSPEKPVASSQDIANERYQRLRARVQQPTNIPEAALAPVSSIVSAAVGDRFQRLLTRTQDPVHITHAAVPQPTAKSPDKQSAWNVAIKTASNSPYLKVRKVQLLESMSDSILTADIQANKPFSIQVVFETAGIAKLELDTPIAYTLQAFARNLATGEVILLHDLPPTPLVEGQSSYAEHLSAAELQPGNYRLQVIVKLNIHSALSYMEIPFVPIA